MERVKFIEHKGKRILYLDLSNGTENDVLTVIEEAKKTIKSEPENSVLSLTDVTHARYNAASVLAMQMFVKGNKPYIRAAAVVGVNAIKKIIYHKILETSQREIALFDGPEKAKDWLVTV